MYQLKKDAFLGVLWKSGNYLFNQVVLLAVKLILIRLLIPEEFGLAAMAYIVISSLSFIGSFGMGAAFIRDNKSDPKKAKNTLFFMSSFFSILIAIVGFFSAPYVAGFFSSKITDPQVISTLVLLIRVLALSYLIRIPAVVPGLMLTKELKFKQKVISGALGTLTYGIVAITLAFMGFGVWAIILGQVAHQIVSNSAVFMFFPFIPSFIFDKKIAKYYFNFGKNKFINTIINIIINNGDDTIIGRILGAAALGFYSLGQHFAGLVVSLISGVINGVMFPVFSKIQNNKELYAKAFYKAFRLTNLILIPAIGGIIILANSIVFLIFGEKWLPILPVFYILSVSALLNIINSLTSPVLNSLNKPHILRNNRLIQLGFFIVLIYPFTKFWGLIGTSLVMVIFSIVSIIYLTPFISKEIEGFYGNVFKIMIKIIPVTLLMMVVVYFVNRLVPTNLFWLFAMVLLGIIVYFIPMWFMDRDLKWDFQEAMLVFKEKLRITK